MRIIIVIFCIILNSCYSIAQIKIDRKYFSDLLNNGKYDDAVIEASKIREKPYGKNAVIDYILAISFCMRGNYSQSQSLFQHIINNYSLKEDQKAFLINERSNCTNTNKNKTLQKISNFSYINYAPLPISGVVGKGGVTFTCRDRDYKSNVGLDISTLESRLFAIDQKKEALEKMRGIVGNGYHVDTSGRFMVVSLKLNNLALDVIKVTRKLEFAYKFYLSTYHLRASDKLITVYLLPDRQALRDVAAKVHKIDLDHNSIGYSSLADLSILGIANPNSVGTLYHELFHLAVRTDVGDIPAWLDEGIASLYSVYEIKDNALYGSPNTWRIQHIKWLTRLSKSKLNFPTLEQLLRMSWFEFEGGEKRNTCISSIHYALANMFLLYLQEKNKVYEMVLSHKERRINPADSFASLADNIHLVEKVMGKTMHYISADYNEWIDKKYNINLLKLTEQKLYDGQSTRYGFDSEIPEYVIGLENQIDSLIMVAQKTASYKDSIDISKIKIGKQRLLQLYRNDFDRYSYRYSRETAEVDSKIEKNDAIDPFSPELNELRKKLTSYESELKDYVKELKNYIIRNQ